MAKNGQAQAIGAALSAYFIGKEMTQVQVATEYNISQSWVGRIYRGEFSQRAAVVSKMCEAAGVPFFEKEDEGRRDLAKHRLLRLLESVWEGTDEDADRLVAALKAIKSLRATSGKENKER